MALTVQMSYYTLCVSRPGASLPQPRVAAAWSLALYLGAMLLAAIPFLPGTGGFVYTGEGFCFIDYYDDTINTVLLASVVVSFSAVWVLTLMTRANIIEENSPSRIGRIAMAHWQPVPADSAVNGKTPRAAANGVFIYAGVFTLYYVCAIPLIVYGYRRADYPTHLHVTSAILAHSKRYALQARTAFVS